MSISGAMLVLIYHLGMVDLFFIAPGHAVCLKCPHCWQRDFI